MQLVQPVGQILDLIEHRVGVLGFVAVTNCRSHRLARLVTVTYPGVPASRRTAMGLTTAAERKAAERINRQVAPWRYRAELEHAIGVAIGRALPTATPSAAPN
jgi:hypothetical protein